MTEAAIGDLLTKYGVDFRLSNPNVELEPATGVRTLDGLAIFLPTVIGANEQFFLVEDTKYPERARTHRWFEVEYGHIVLFTSSGTFTSGTNAGATYEANDLFSYGEINLLKRRRLAKEAQPRGDQVSNVEFNQTVDESMGYQSISYCLRSS